MGYSGAYGPHKVSHAIRQVVLWGQATLYCLATASAETKGTAWMAIQVSGFARPSACWTIQGGMKGQSAACRLSHLYPVECACKSAAACCFEWLLAGGPLARPGNSSLVSPYVRICMVCILSCLHCRSCNNMRPLELHFVLPLLCATTGSELQKGTS